jgi:hypothetical protein
VGALTWSNIALSDLKLPERSEVEEEEEEEGWSSKIGEVVVIVRAN